MTTASDPDKLDVIVNVTINGIGFASASGAWSLINSFYHILASSPDFVLTPVGEGETQGDYSVVSVELVKTIDRWSGAIPTVEFTAADIVSETAVNPYFATQNTIALTNLDWVTTTYNGISYRGIYFDAVCTWAGALFDTDDLVVGVKPSGVTQAPFAELEA